MTFNNLPCTLVPPNGTPAAAGAAANTSAVPAKPNPGGANPTASLLLEYAPIEYVTLPLGIFATAFTQFLVR